MPRTYRRREDVLRELREAGHDVSEIRTIQGRAHAVMGDGSIHRVDQIERAPESRKAEYERNKAHYSFSQRKRYAEDEQFRSKKLSRSAEVYAYRRANGECTGCGAPHRVGKVNVCSDCWWKQKAGDFFGSVRHADKMRAVFDAYDGRCYLTGRKLSIGVDTSFDHILPRCDRPEAAELMDNLAPCHVDVNVAKNCIPIDKFIRLCHEVAGNTEIPDSE